MAPKKSTIVLNVEQFIHDIEERPAIWNRNFHCNKAFLEQMWDELSSTHKLPSKYENNGMEPHERSNSRGTTLRRIKCETETRERHRKATATMPAQLR